MTFLSVRVSLLALPSLATMTSRRKASKVATISSFSTRRESYLIGREGSTVFYRVSAHGHLKLRTKPPTTTLAAILGNPENEGSNTREEWYILNAIRDLLSLQTSQT